MLPDVDDGDVGAGFEGEKLRACNVGDALSHVDSIGCCRNHSQKWKMKNKSKN